MKKNSSTTRILIEFSPAEAESWKNFMTVMKPPEVSIDDFSKQVFLLGAQFLNDTLTRMAEDAKMQAGGEAPPTEAPADDKNTEPKVE